MDVLDGPSGSELPQKSQQIDLLPVLTRTPMGKAMAHMAVVFAELERDFIRMRTREALEVKKENGVTLGRPRSTPDDVVARFCGSAWRARTAYAIARDLNKDAVPTAQVVGALQMRARAVGVRTISF